MKRIALMTTAMTTAVVMMTGVTFADELTHTTVESRKHVTTTPTDPAEAPLSVQEKSHVQTEQQSSTVTSDPVSPPPSLQYLCDEETLFPTACYRYKAVELLDRLGNATQLTRECLRLEASQRRGCFHGLGHVMTEAVFSDPTQLALLCRHGSPTDQIVCIEGAIEKLAQYDEERARTACASLNNDLRPVCEQAVTDKMYSLTKRTFALYYDKDKVDCRRTVMATAVVAPSPHDPAH